MKRLVLVESEVDARRELAAHLRSDGHEVIEVDEERALELYQERIDAVVVWTAHEVARAAAVLREIRGASRPRILFYAGAVSADPREAGGVVESSTPLIGDSPAMRDLQATLRRLACRPRTHVLVGGEAGSGKQMLARALHHGTSGAGEFVHLSGARLTALLESGLGSFGDGVTLYLPSIEDVEKSAQCRLAELLADHECSGAPVLRLVIGVMRSAQQQVSLGRLVERAVHPELAARVPVLLDLLPLRKRKSDVPLLVMHLLEGWSKSSGLPRPDVTPAALDALGRHGWPGNVRELVNVLERAALSGRSPIDVTDLPSLEAGDRGVDYELPSSGIDFSALERAMLVQALALSRGNQTQAAALLGLTRDQVRYRMAKFKIPRSSSPDGD